MSRSMAYATARAWCGIFRKNLKATTKLYATVLSRKTRYLNSKYESQANLLHRNAIGDALERRTTQTDVLFSPSMPSWSTTFSEVLHRVSVTLVITAPGPD
ncbi:hypothetical protein RRG08_036674 [Elysia crispata]|uniref:Uncharacterized protein n=1 Tax=Elysia crispata TaxID=231223 RepID=A0AAE1DXF6_9GAST|nr:hypothetical protein RRG08_036674 [Elysia crispata]